MPPLGLGRVTTESEMRISVTGGLVSISHLSPTSAVRTEGFSNKYPGVFV